MKDGVKVLLVDDEPGFLEQAEIFLEKEEEALETTAASSADKGLELLDTESFDVIVSDYQMPDIDGLEFLEEVREERESDIPFIIFTGKGREEVAMEALNLGADRYLQKGGDPRSQYGVLAQAIMQEYKHHQSEKKYRTVVENTHDAIYIYRGDEFLFVNERAAEVTGYSREELYDINMSELLHPEDRERVEELVEKRAAGEDVPSKYNARIITKEGETKYLHLTVTPIRFKGQKALLGSASDITELKKAEEEREEYINELKFIQNAVVEVSRMEDIDEMCGYIADSIHSLNEGTYVGVTLMDREDEEITLRALKRSEDFEAEIRDFFTEDLASMGINPEEMTDRLGLYTTGKLENIPDGLYGLFEEKVPKDRCREIEEILGIEEVLTVGFALGDEPYGGIIILKKEGSKIRHKDAIETLASHISVLLHKKQDEKRQRLSDFSLEQASMEIYWITPDGEFIFTNETVSERLGYSKEELKGMYIWDVDPNHDEDIRGERWEMLKEEKTLTFESEHETKDGEVYPVEITSSYLEFDGKEYEFAFAEDITERKKKEKELREERNFIEQIAETSPVCITKVDKEGNITYANDRAEEVLGLAKSEIKGRTYDDPEWKITDYEGEEYPDEGLPFEQIKEKGEPVYDVRHAIEWPDGERKLFSINAAPLYDEDGNFDGMVATIDDVTEEVEKTRELEESRRRLKTLMDNIPGIAYRCLNDRDWTMKFISDGCEELTGYDPEEFIGEEGLVFADIIHPEDRDYIWREVQNAAEEERPYELEYRIETSDGEERWVWEQGEVVDSGEEEFLEGMIMDINERKRMEKRVKRERDRAQRYLETAEVMMVTIDPKGKVIQANKKACEVLGCDKEEIIGEDWFENFIPKDQREELRGTHGGFIERGEIEDGYHGNPVITKDGEEKMVEWSNNIIRDEGGEVIGTLSSGRDITEAEKRREEVKRSEERYRRLFESAQDGILILDVDTGVIKDANPYIQDILGYSEEELIGKKIWEIGGFHNIAEDKKKFEELVGKGYVRYDDLPLRSKEGREVPVEFISNTYEVKGEIVAQCNIREISERKKVEEREEYLHSLLRHDIKNKVQLIDGYFSLLEDTDLPEEARSSVEKGKNMTKNTMDLIEKVRKLRELGEEEIIEVDMNSVLSSVLSNYEKQMKSEGIDVDVERVECRVKGGSLLEEVFHNLIENSIRHSNCSELSIQIKEIEDECRVIFEDDGKGIPDDVKEKIFDKGFKKGENAGSGLGMYLAKEIVESYGGSVEVKDSEMGGARFDVRLKKI